MSRGSSRLSHWPFSFRFIALPLEISFVLCVCNCYNCNSDYEDYCKLIRTNSPIVPLKVSLANFFSKSSGARSATPGRQDRYLRTLCSDRRSKGCPEGSVRRINIRQKAQKGSRAQDNRVFPVARDAPPMDRDGSFPIHRWSVTSVSLSQRESCTGCPSEAVHA